MRLCLIGFVVLYIPCAVGFSGGESMTCEIDEERADSRIRYPFSLREEKAFPGFGLMCDHSRNYVITLPQLGNLTILNINYEKQSITVNDSNGCVIRHFKDQSPTLYPFRTIYSSFTLLQCSSPFSSNLSGWNNIRCLSGNTIAINTSLLPDFRQELNSCSQDTLITKAPFDLLENNGITTELFWDFPDCRSCKGRCGVNYPHGNFSVDPGCSKGGSLKPTLYLQTFIFCILWPLLYLVLR